MASAKHTLTSIAELNCWKSPPFAIAVGLLLSLVSGSLLALPGVICGKTALEESQQNDVKFRYGNLNLSSDYGLLAAEGRNYAPSDSDDFIQPFSDSMLPRNQLQGTDVPGLGRVMVLDTFAKPQLNMATTFSIYTRAQIVRELKYKPVTRTSSNSSAANGSGDRFEFDLGEMRQSGFDASKPTAIFISGYRSGPLEDWMHFGALAWLELHKYEANAIIVNWSDSNKGVYSKAVANTVLVARQTTIFLIYLAQVSLKQRGLKLSEENLQKFFNSFHLIGHSLGAHIAGFVGQDLGGRVGRITGLDPAGPSFDGFPRDQRLDRSDAKLVEVLHTNSGQMNYLKAIASAPLKALGTLLANHQASATTSLQEGDESEYTAWFGIDSQIGHIDYYANNGRVQPGCAGSLHICDHKRAFKIYVDLLRFASRTATDLGQLQPGHGLSSEPLLAFRAESFEALARGENFASACPGELSIPLIRHKVHLHSCAIPLFDLTKPVDELIEELKTHYQIKTFDHTSTETADQADPQPRFYFKTTGLTAPTSGDLIDGQDTHHSLVGDHYLLKVYLGSSVANNGLETSPAMSEAALVGEQAGACSLAVQLRMADGERVLLEHSKVERESVQRLANGQRMLAIPFVHPAGTQGRLLLEQMFARPSWRASLQAHEEEAHSILWHGAAKGTPEFSTYFKQLFPKVIALTLNAADKSRACHLTIKAITMAPITSHEQHLSAFYGRHLLWDAHVPLVPDSQLATLLRDSQLATALGLEEHSELLETELIADSPMSSFSVGLEAALVPDKLLDICNW